MAVKQFKDLLVWQKAQDFAVDVYTIFGGIRDFAFRDQISRDSVSISNNSAEGFNRNSNANFSRFLYFSLASTCEVRSMHISSIRLEFFEKTRANNLIKMTNEISNKLYGLIKSINS